jgi:sulfite exporter TauE/SafE
MEGGRTMEWTLALSALLMGLAGTPHCAAMCGPACAAVVGPASSRGDAPARALAFHGGRLLSYAVGGAVAAAGVAWLAGAAAVAPFLRPLWALLHVAAIVLGLWLMTTGRQPGWMASLGRGRHPLQGRDGWQAMRAPEGSAGLAGRTSPVRAAAAGSLWVAWPCGLLQSAIVVAGLANTPQAGALVMVAFGVASAPGLQLAPWLWSRWQGGGAAGMAANTARREVAIEWFTRLAGAMLAAGSVWALGMDIWGQVWAYCFG